MKLIPMSDRVLLKWVEAEKVTKSGIFIPETGNKERPFMYEVVQVGPGKNDKDGSLVTIDLKPGDKVICGQYSGDEVKLDWVEYKIVGYEYILLKVEG